MEIMKQIFFVFVCSYLIIRIYKRYQKVKKEKEKSKSLTQEKKVLAEIRCKDCNARLFDSRFYWEERPISSAIIIIKCWRCKKLKGFSPIKKVGETS